MMQCTRSTHFPPFEDMRQNNRISNTGPHTDSPHGLHGCHRCCQHRKFLGDRETFPVSHMIRKDNSEQRQRADGLLGGARSFQRDPRPLNQQFREMGANEVP